MLAYDEIWMQLYKQCTILTVSMLTQWTMRTSKHVYMVTLMVSISIQRLTKYSLTKDLSDTDVVNFLTFLLISSVIDSSLEAHVYTGSLPGTVD